MDDVASPLQGRPVLLVDPDGDSRSVLAEAFRAAGAMVHPVATARDACDLLAPTGAAFGVLVCDLREGQEGQWPILQELRRLASWHAIPALAVCSFATVEGRDEALAAG